MTTQKTSDLFLSRASVGPEDIEAGSRFAPKFDGDGLIGCVVTEAGTNALLMFAHMNADALARSIDTGYAYFWSRSRKKLWKKGEESGNLLRIVEIRTDCDQDVLSLTVEVEGAGVACHTGEKSCFYRRIATRRDGGTVALERISSQRSAAKS